MMLLMLISFLLFASAAIAQIPDQSAILPFLMQTYGSLGSIAEAFEREVPDSECKRHLKFAHEGFDRNEVWVYEMIDAWAKPQTGILTGNLMHIGNYDECLEINSIYNGTRIRGKYCSAMIASKDKDLTQMFINIIHDQKLNDEEDFAVEITNSDVLKTSWGMCFPASCMTQDLADIWNFTRQYLKLEVDVYFDENYCSYEGKRPLSNAAIVTIVILALFGTIIVLSAVYDLMIYQKRNKTEPSVIIAFSAYTNGRKILSTKTSNDCLRYLNGIRVISMMWIILAHRLSLVFDTPHLNARALMKATTKPQSMIFISISYAVDTFFVISGFLIAYLFLQHHEKGLKLNVPMFYLHRLFRLTPSLAMLVLVYSTLILYGGEGPFWYFIYDSVQKPCEKNWWATLLYIQNYLYPQNYCMPQSWYLAVDTQLYFLSPLILIPLTKWPKKTAFAVFLLTLASIATVFAQSYVLKLPSNIFRQTPESHEFSVSTHWRASSWLIGILLGCGMHRMKYVPVKINRIAIWFIWILTVSGFCSVIFGHLAFTGNKYNLVESVLFNTFARPCWSLCVSWIIFACEKGYGGVANKILSLPIFTFLIKINYNMYLLHFMPLLYFAGQGRMSTYTTVMQECYAVWSDVIAAIIFAFVWTLAFEAPVIGLEKIIFKKGAGKKSVKENGVNTIESGRTDTNKT